MCGLAGFVSAEGETHDQLVEIVQRMAAALAHRGPDDRGEWIDVQHGVSMGFRRLAIIDVSAAGHQPMTSASGRYVATMNGEIYNFRELRETLERDGSAPAFRGHSDTEVMLAAFERWGVVESVKRFNGMFAIAVWDRTDRRFVLVRDRIGVKPLFFGRVGRTFLYGSELKALRQHPRFQATLDRVALEQYFRFLYVPGPRSIYQDIQKLQPGTILSFDPISQAIETTAYWSPRQAALDGLTARFRGDEHEASLAIESIARDAVRLRLVADVPIGVFLSGGVDSSLVTALMQAESSRPVRSFSIGVGDRRYDEADQAQAVANHLGTDHSAMYVTPEEAMAVIPSLPSMYDEPLGDSSQIPTHLVAALARRSVTVALSGDGGDELFGGYVRYQIGSRSANALVRLPARLRRLAARALATPPARVWDRILGVASPLLPLALRPPQVGERLHKIARVLTSADPDAMYFELVSHWQNLVLGGGPSPAPVDDRASWPPLADPIERMMYLDQISYLPDDILTKVDRASMAVSLEAREPLLDYRLIELAWTLPVSMKVRGGSGKPVLRRILRRYLPDSLVDRPKMGFGIPLDRWLRGQLRDWAESLLEPRLLKRQGWLNAELVREKWNAHVDGRADWKHYLWAVLMFQAWLQENGEDGRHRGQ